MPFKARHELNTGLQAVVSTGCLPSCGVEIRCLQKRSCRIVNLMELLTPGVDISIQCNEMIIWKYGLPGLVLYSSMLVIVQYRYNINHNIFGISGRLIKN